MMSNQVWLHNLLLHFVIISRIKGKKLRVKNVLLINNGMSCCYQLFRHYVVVADRVHHVLPCE